MTSFVEDEVKVALPPDVALPALSDERAGLVADPQPPVTLTSAYWDTSDGRLQAAGITVRRRTRGRVVTWDVKAPLKRGDTGVRHEASFASRSTTPPAAVTDLLRAWLGGEALRPVATLKTRRLTWTVRDASGIEVAEVVDDEVSHVDGGKVLASFRELEVERRGVAPSYVARLVRRLEKAGGEPLSVTKLGRVLPLRLPPAPRVRPSGPVSALVGAGLRNGTTDLLLADVGARLGADDAVHQMRVSARRLRSVLRGFGAALDADWVASIAEELHWVGEALGVARDMEVLEGRLVAAVLGLGEKAGPLLADVAARRAAADAAVVEALGSERYLAFAARVRTECVAPPFVAAGDEVARTVAARVVGDAWRGVERAVRSAHRRGAPAAAWHRVRIKAKRARYAAETAAPVLGKDARRIAKAAAAAQDALGVFHDTAGTVALLADLASEHAGDTAYGYVAGRLTEREIAAGVAAREAFDAVWKKAT